MSNPEYSDRPYPSRDSYNWAYTGTLFPLILVADYTRCYFGMMLALHTRRAVTDEGHRHYFSREVLTP